MDNEELYDEIKALKTRISMIETLLINTNGKVNNEKTYHNNYKPIKISTNNTKDNKLMKNEHIEQHSITY